MASPMDEGNRGATGRITRRGFLQKGGLAATWVALGLTASDSLAGAAVADDPGGREGSEMPKERAMKVPMEVEYEPDWLTWVASTAGCLKALGLDCDNADVAGYSGYAFLMNVHKDVDPSGPTAFDWGLLLPGVQALGRSELVFRGAHCPCELEHGADPGLIHDEMQAAYDLVEREIKAGRPCVLWGTYEPEFGIVVGIEEKSYLVKTFKERGGEPQPPIPFDKVIAPGGAYVLAFPTPVQVPRARADRDAVHHALTMLNYRPGDPQYATGLAAYDTWIAALEAGKRDSFGNSFNAVCWRDAKRFARDFVARLAERNQAVEKPLHTAAAGYGQAAEAMAKATDLFSSEEGVDAAETCKAAIEALRRAKAAETTAATALAQAAKQWPQETPEA